MALTKITPQMFDTSATAHDLNVDNGTFVVDGSASRVGIGTATPSTLLDVNGALTATSIAGTLTTAAQTNITSVGTLTGLALTGNVTLTKTSADALFKIVTGGGNDAILELDAPGASGAQSHIKFSDSGTVAGSIIYAHNSGGTDYMTFGTGGNNTTALTLDSSQNATFAGAITTSTPSTFSGGSVDYAIVVSSTDAYTGIRFTDPNGSGDLFYNGSANHLYLHNSTFAVAGQTLAANFEFQVNGDSNFTGNIALLTDSGKALLGASSDLQIYHDGSNNVINSANSHSLRIAVGGTNQWEFHPSSIFKGNDGKKIILGDSSDLQLYHDGSNSYVTNSTAALILDSGSVNVVSGVTNTQTTWPLHVSYSNNSGAHGGIQVTNQNTGTTSNWAGLSAHAVNGGVQSFFYSADYDTWGVGLFAGTATNHPYHLFSNNTERMRITAGGDVSVGSDHAGFSGWRVLNIRGQSTGGLVNFENSSGTRSATFANQSPGIRYQTHISGGYHRFETDGTPNGYPLFIKDNGYIGMGTGAPTAQLTITDENAGQASIQARNFAVSATGSFVNQHAFEFRAATSTTTHGMLVALNENNIGRRSLEVADSTGIFATFVQGKLGLGLQGPGRRKLEINDESPGIVFHDSNVTNLTHEIIGGGNAGLEISADYQNVGTGYIRLDIGANNFHKFHEGGSILNRHVNSTQGRHFFVGTVSAWSNGNRYVHVQLSTTGNAMLAVHVFGYSYLCGIIEGMGAGYNYNNANQTAMYNNYKNGSVVAMHQNNSNSYSEVVIDTVGTATSNRWGAIAIYATDDLGQSDKIEIVQYAFNASSARLYT